MESIWLKEYNAPEFPSLDRDLEADAAVVGGGLAGILTAYFLAEHGKRVVVLEGRRIGLGATAYTTAKITSQHGLCYAKLIRNYGQERARQYAKANQKAIKSYQHIIESKHIGCDYLPAYADVYSIHGTDNVREEAEAARICGIDAEFVTDTELPFAVDGSVRFSGQAQFHPLKFLSSLARGLEIYEHSFVTDVNSHRLTVKTDEGEYTVKAQDIVIATHYPMINAPGFYFTRMHQSLSYVLALKSVPALNGMYLSAGEDGFSFRSYGDTLLIGGCGHRTGARGEINGYEQLKEAAKHFFPGTEIAARWSNEDSMPHDGLPFIGRYSRATPHIYVASGFQKWGMTSAMIAAMMLSDEISDITNEFEGLFSPRRLHIAAAAGPFFKDMGITLQNLIFKKFMRAGTLEEEKKKGFGPTCPHLGCTMTWNETDQTWDCPCHGSRFTADGSIINNPAKKGMDI